MEWVLNITQARFDAHRAGEPDPYGLAPPDDLPEPAHSEAGAEPARESTHENERSTP